MTTQKPNLMEDVICLANSRKHSGRCIAGKRVSDGSWIRPIGAGPGHEITELDRRYQNGETAQVFDVIAIPCVERRPLGFQTENVLIDTGFYWQSVRKASWAEASTLATDTDLWTNGYSAYHCHNNRIPETQLDAKQGSLRLIRVESVALTGGPKAPEFNNNKYVVRASFSFRSFTYTMDVTDPVLERACMQQGPGEYELGTSLICVSLSELHQGYTYKLVASILAKTVP